MLLLGLVGRLWYLMNVRAEYYSKKAEDLHERERDIKAARERSWTSGEIFWQITGQSAQYR